MKTEYKLKHDGFRKVRGGSAKVLDIICAKCKNKVLVYQKPLEFTVA
jgi:ribosomal protein S27E